MRNGETSLLAKVGGDGNVAVGNGRRLRLTAGWQLLAVPSAVSRLAADSEKLVA